MTEAAGAHCGYTGRVTSHDPETKNVQMSMNETGGNLLLAEADVAEVQKEWKQKLNWNTKNQNCQTRVARLLDWSWTARGDLG